MTISSPTSSPTIADRPFCANELAELGLTRHQLRGLVHAGQLRRVLRGVYVRTDVADSVELRAACAAMAVEPHHVVCDRTAAWIHGVDVMTYAEHELLPPIEVCTLRGRHPTERGGVDGRSRDLRPADIMTVGAVRLTTPLRTALDLACLLHRRDAYATLNEFARDHGITADQLNVEIAQRYRGRRGVRQARALATIVDPRVESMRESWTLLEILDAGFPSPEPQWWIYVDSVPTYRLDFAYPQHRIAIEYDGVAAHLLTPEQRRHDEARRQWLREHGWTVIVVRRGDFTGARLLHWLNELREALQPTYSNRRW